MPPKQPREEKDAFDKALISSQATAWFGAIFIVLLLVFYSLFVGADINFPGIGNMDTRSGMTETKMNALLEKHFAKGKVCRSRFSFFLFSLFLSSHPAISGGQ